MLWIILVALSVQSPKIDLVPSVEILHFVSTEMAMERVIRMGEEPSRVYVTGCPSIDIAADVLSKPCLDFDPFGKYGGVGQRVDLSDGYVVVMQHPVTTEYGMARHHVNETLMAMKNINCPVLWFWPNVDAGSDGTSRGIRAFREAHNPENFHFFKNMAPDDFLRLLYNSKCLVGNSSVGIRESSFLGVPVVNIGSRQTGRERGQNVIDVDYDRKAIEQAVLHHMNNGRFNPDRIYGTGQAGKRIAQLLAEVELKIEKRLTY